MTMQVTVKTLDSETREFTVSDEATVEEFKNQIASAVGIPAERQRLIFKGKVLQDSSKLQSYGVDGCVIHLVERRPPTQRTHPDGASAERSGQDGGNGDGPGFNMTPDVMNLSQQIVQGLISQLGLNSAQANVSTSQSGDGATLNVHINLLASANAANDAGVRIARARQFLRAGRASLNRSEGDNSVLPESTVTMGTGPSTTESQSGSSNTQQSSNDSNTNQNNSPDVLADVLGELLELNSTMQPYLQRYITLLNSNTAENLLPSDDSLPDRVAEALHNLSHAYHALSDLTFNFRSPEPRRLNVLPSLSNHVGATPLLSSLFSSNQPTTAQSGQQTPQANTEPRVHAVPGTAAIAFTSIISGSLPPSGIYNQQPSTTTTGGASRAGSMFNFSFGSSGSHGNTQQTTSSSSTTSSTSTSTQNTPQGTEGRDNVRIVMDDFVALFSNSQPVTSHSETSRTSTTTPSQQHSQGDTDTQTQNSGTTASSRAVPRINIGGLPLNGNHQDPLVPCESFHFGPRSRQPQGNQTESDNSQSNPASGLAQAFSDAVASALQDTVSGRMSSGGRQSEQATTGQQSGNATTNRTTPVTSSATSSEAVNPLVQVLSALHNIENEGPRQQTSTRSSQPTPNQRASAQAREISMLQNVIMNTIGQAVRRDEDPQTISDFLNEVDEAVGGTVHEMRPQGPFLNRLIERFQRTMTLQDMVFMLMGLPDPYVRLRNVVRQYPLTDLLDGAPATDANIRHVSSEITAEILDIAGELLLRIPKAEGIDVVASVGALLEDAFETTLKMSRDLDNASFAERFPDHVRQASTDLCILFTMCFRDGLTGASHFVGMRLPEEMTRDLNEHMLQTFQATSIRYVETAYRFRHQREEILKRFVKKEKPKEEAASEDSQKDAAEACEASSQKSDDSDSFATPPLSMSLNDVEEYVPLEDQEDIEMEEDDEEDWKTVVPEDWVPIIARDVMRQRRLPQQAPFSDGYLSGLPPKRRKEPVRRVVGLTHGHRRNGVDRTAVRKTDEVIEIPFLKSLQQMLSDPSIYYEVEHPHQRVDGLLADFCDGEAFKNHPLFKRYPTALQILLYYDEIEIVNPLGSKTSKHKLGLFYYTLGNIRPEFRSQLKTIQLLAVAARPIVKKYGINTILETFMEELSELEEDEGFHCTINGEEKILRGTIAYSSGDNLGSQEMGGYKIGPGANFKCRECMGSADDIKTKFHERYFTMRTPESYDDQCSQIENSDEDISKQFGICQDSILNQSKYFHVVGSLPGDAMHDVLEGVLQLECKEFLKYVIYESNYLSLDNLNQRILSFDYGYYNDKNKPSGINPRTMNATNNTLKQSASQAWCLARFLPSILGSSIPEEDEKFQLYLLLLEIVEIIFSPLTSCSQASYLQTLIEEHHIKFKELYPSASIIPKMHYMIHYPRTITSLGPMVRSWCMRYESKHTYFKQVAIALGNFINVPYTVAERHQKMQSCQFLDVKEQGSNFLMKPLETGPGFQCVAADEANKENLQRADGNIKEDDLIYKPSWVKVLGTKYKIGAIIHIGNDDYLPLFGVINNIYVLSSSNHRVYFEVDCLHTQEFSPVYRTYIVQKLIHPNTTDQRAVSSTSENMSSILRQAVLAAGVTPKTSMEALATDAQQSDDLHEAYRGEVKKAVKRRTSKDADYNPDTFPSTKDYLESS